MVTTVVLIRHAKPVETTDYSDFTRPISDEGKLIQKKMDQYLKERLVVPDQIWHSPFIRAKETAEIIGRDFSVSVSEELALGDFFDEEELLEKLARANKQPNLGPNPCIFLVGHGPQLMRLATHAAGMQCYPETPSSSSALLIEFKEKISPGSGNFVSYYTVNDLF
jgi:phosphohistidine phosphatase SixA